MFESNHLNGNTSKCRVKKNDTVIVIAGKSKGQVGKVLKVKPRLQQVIVENANLIKKHVKPNPNINEVGGIKSQEAPIHISNVAIYNPNTKKADKIGYKSIEENGKMIKKRYFKSNQEFIEAN